MAYTIQFTGGARASGLASSTQCVFVTASITSLLQQYDHATLSAGVFSFYLAGDSTIRAQRTFTLETLVSVPPGAQVFAADASNLWRVGTVISDGTNSIGPSGSATPGTTPAAAFKTDNGQSAAPGTQLTLIGTASDGTLWFSGPTGQQYVCAAQSTVAALAGSLAAVNANGWQVMQL